MPSSPSSSSLTPRLTSSASDSCAGCPFRPSSSPSRVCYLVSVLLSRSATHRPRSGQITPLLLCSPPRPQTLSPPPPPPPPYNVLSCSFLARTRVCEYFDNYSPLLDSLWRVCVRCKKKKEKIKNKKRKIWSTVNSNYIPASCRRLVHLARQGMICFSRIS